MTDIILTVKLKEDFWMGHSKATKAGSHDRIVKAAASRVRENGVEGIGVSARAAPWRLFGRDRRPEAPALDRSGNDGIGH
jgi:hypothetical protein